MLATTPATSTSARLSALVRKAPRCPQFLPDVPRARPLFVFPLSFFYPLTPEVHSHQHEGPCNLHATCSRPSRPDPAPLCQIPFAALLPGPRLHPCHPYVCVIHTLTTTPFLHSMTKAHDEIFGHTQGYSQHTAGYWLWPASSYTYNTEPC